MSDFVERFVNAIRQAEAAKGQNKLASAELQRLKRKLAPDLWSELRLAITRKCEAINKALGRGYFRINPSLFLKLHVTKLEFPVANLHLEFIQSESRVHYDSGPCLGDYLIDLEDKTARPYLTDRYGHEFDIEQTAERLLENCLEKAQF